MIFDEKKLSKKFQMKNRKKRRRSYPPGCDGCEISGSDEGIDLVIYDEDHCDDRVFKNALLGMKRLSWMGHLCPDCKTQFLDELAKMMA